MWIPYDEQQPGSIKVAEGVFFFFGCIQISNAPCGAEYIHLFDERNNKPYTIHMQASHELGKKKPSLLYLC